jgi:transcriptional regulator with XRE-family HTH domain
MSSALGRKVRDLRKAMGLTLDELAKLAESSKSYVWELETKDVARPSAEKLSKIASVLGVTPDYLIDGSRTEATADDRDEHFFRKYQAASPEVKEKIKRIFDLLDE